MRILLRTPLSSTTGFGRDGLGIVKELLRREHSVDLLPTSVFPPIPPNVADLLQYPIEGKYDLELHHVPPVAADVFRSSKVRSAKKVLWSMWEWYTPVPHSVRGWENTQNIKMYDQVVGYTKQSLTAFNAGEYLRDDQETAVVQGGFDPELWKPASSSSQELQEIFPPRETLRGEPFRFSMMGVLGMRKNPYTVLRAFEELKEEMGDDFNAEFWIKSSWPMLPNNYESPGVRYSQESFTDEEMQHFYWSIDCLINCAWGEGKDLPSMEASASGVPIIINDIPGHRGWNHPSIQPLVPSTRMYMDGPDGEYEGRFTSKVDIKEAMLEVYSHRRQAYRRAGELGSYLSQSASWSKRIDQLGKKIGIPL